MKKLYSIVLMAAALLVGTNAWAESVATWDALRAALEDGGEVTLSQDINVLYDATTFKSILIGAKNSAGTALAVDGTAPAAAVLDLAGHNITITANSAVAINPFVLTKGSLKVTGTGTIEVTGTTGTTKDHNNQDVATGYPTSSTNVFFVFGGDANNKVNPKGENPFSKLEIDENVTVKTKNGTVIAIDQLTASHAALTKTDFAGKGYATNGMAYGAFVDVKGTLISEGADHFVEKTLKTKNNSKVDSLDAQGHKIYYEDGKKCYGIKVNGLVTLPADAADKIYTPYVYVEPSAVIRADMRSGLAGATAIYASGFGQWLIEGNCSGASGVYISSGIVAINDATVKSAADTYIVAGSGTHANGSGSAIVINSRDSRSGDVEVTVSGDTKAESTSGYALEEIVNTKSDNSKVESIAIEGGSFEGGSQGALVITSTTASEAQVVVNGGNVEGAANVGTEGLAEFLNNQGGTHATLIDDGNGHTTLVISTGDAPVGYATIAAALNEGKTSVKLTGASDAISGNIVLDELEINEATAQVLTIAEGKSLTVGRVVLGTNAQIIVEPGAKFIVTGTQGIVAPVVTNIILQTSETAQATFLFNPAVTSNRHPNATVQLISKSFYEGGKEVHQRFGMPTYNGNVTLSPVNPGSVITMIKTWDYATDDWSAWSNISSGVTYTDAEPFRGYMLASNNVKASPMTYELKGELVGNDDAEITYRYGWNNLANSYAAPINIKEFIGTVLKSTGTDILATIYLYKDLGNDTYTWQAVNNATAGKQEYVIEGGVPVLKTTPSEITPMQAFLMQLRAAGTAKQSVDYEHNVYNPALGIPNSNNAPARDRDAVSKMQLAIFNTEVADNLTLIEDDQFSSELDNGYDAVKYGFNNGLKLYAMNNEERMEVVATDNVEGTFLGVNAAKAGNYTMTLYALNGMEYAIVDMETGKVVLAEEGSTYNFFAEAGHNDYRFQIVTRANMPTAIENAEVVSNVKGIYTITGQYVGEKFDVLPKGAYIVNGVKVIK